MVRGGAWGQERTIGDASEETLVEDGNKPQPDGWHEFESAVERKEHHVDALQVRNHKRRGTFFQHLI